MTKGDVLFEGTTWGDKSKDINNCRAASLASIALGVDCYTRSASEGRRESHGYSSPTRHSLKFKEVCLEMPPELCSSARSNYANGT